MALAVFLGRFWSAPRRVALAFPVDRRALARHAALDLTEDRIRGALATLERVGFIVREVAAPGHRYQRTNSGLQRRPILFRFSLDVMPDFLAANTRRKSARPRPTAARGGNSRSTPYVGTFPALRPSLALPGASPKLFPTSPIGSSVRKALFLGDQRSSPPTWTARPMPVAPASDLAAALDRIRAARARSLAPGCKAPEAQP